MKAIGVDPGKSGALALVERVNGLSVLREAIDIPLMGSGPTEEVDALEIIRWIVATKADHAFVEKVHAQPAMRGGERHGMGASSAFRFGASFGALKACVVGCRVPMTLVTPQAWKKHYSLPGVSVDPQAKERARALAIARFPAAAELLRRKKDHQRGEAALIALYGLGLHG